MLGTMGGIVLITVGDETIVETQEALIGSSTRGNVRKKQVGNKDQEFCINSFIWIIINLESGQILICLV